MKEPVLPPRDPEMGEMGQSETRQRAGAAREVFMLAVVPASLAA